MRSVIYSILGFFLGALLGWALWFLVSIFMGAGHGTYLPAKLLFPYTMASTRWTHTITDTAILAGCLSYSTYGAVLGLSVVTAKRKRVIISLLGLHSLAAVLCLCLVDSAF